MTTYSGITVESLDGHVELTLNRPEKRNSLTLVVIEELIDALEMVRQSDAFGVILASAGPVFCAGHDFDDMVARDLPQMRELMQRCSRLMQLIHEIPQT
ncbi:MAG: enoyl-CoA hydratase/isomerase family protein, partial [Anaerolineales bacterium]|nr:enoyl-CoA hydratase/isomerase family protein [Anaerolineales bacterium]